MIGEDGPGTRRPGSLFETASTNDSGEVTADDGSIPVRELQLRTSLCRGELWQLGGKAEVLAYLAYHLGVLNQGNELHSSLALGTG
jgi:hypothetical protein